MSNGKRGGQPGNQNAAGAAQWNASINKALELRNKSRKDGKDALNELAEQLLTACDNGEGWALKELGDRLDGKAPQALIHQGDENKPVVTKKARFVSPDSD